MSETQPHVPDEVDAPEQLAQVPEDNLGEQPTDSPNDEADLWDHQKAKTLAAVAKVEGTLDAQSERHQELKLSLPDPDNVFERDRRMLHPWAGKYRQSIERNDWAIQQLKDFIPTSDNPEAERELLEIKYEHSAQELQISRETLEQVRAREIEKSRERIEQDVDTVLSPFEELYNANPERFANMPTSEFMEIGQELVKIKMRIARMESGARRQQFYEENIDQYFESKTLVPAYNVEQMTRDYMHLLALNDEAKKSTIAGVEAIYEDFFDKSPHQMMDSIKEKAAEFTAKFQEERDAAQAELDEFLAKQKTEVEEQE